MLRFLSKLVLICNACFAVSVVLRMIEQRALKEAGSGALHPLPFYLQWLLILGVAALLLNLLFWLLCLVHLAARRPLPVARWLLWVNALSGMAELIYYFA